MRQRERPSSAVLAAALCLIWALTFIAQRTALREAGPLWIAAGRTVVGALALAPALRMLSRGGWRIAAAIGLTSVVGFVGLQLVGLEAIGAGPSAAIVYTQPVLVAIGAHLWLNERLTRTRAAGALIGLAGVTVVSAHELSAASPGAVAALLGSAVCWTAGTLLTRATPEQPVLALVAAQHALAAPVLLGLAAVDRAGPDDEHQARLDDPLRRRVRRGRRPAAVHDPAAPRRGVGRRRLDVQRADHRRRARGDPARRAAAGAAGDRPRAGQRGGAAGDPPASSASTGRR